MLEGGQKSTNIGLEIGVAIGVDATKSGKNNNLLVIMRVRLLQKDGLCELTNRIRFKEGSGHNILTKSVRDYCRMSLMLNMPYIYYRHTNVDLLGRGSD